MTQVFIAIANEFDTGMVQIRFFKHSPLYFISKYKRFVLIEKIHGFFIVGFDQDLYDSFNKVWIIILNDILSSMFEVDINAACGMLDVVGAMGSDIFSQLSVRIISGNDVCLFVVYKRTLSLPLFKF